jgi:phosphoribosylamine--glycine ligase
VKRIMEDRVFGDAGSRVVIEEFLTGEEASFLAFTDGETVLPMASTQDHKAAFDDDKGPNTGGMGAYSPAPVVTEALHQKIMTQIMIPTVKAMAAEGRPHDALRRPDDKDGDAGAGTQRARHPRPNPSAAGERSAAGPRSGDGAAPARHRAPLAAGTGGLRRHDGRRVPGRARHDRPITGLAAAARLKDVMVFHAGTARVDNTIVTRGGRVLGVTALGLDIRDAVSRAYRAVDKIRWDGVHYRTDIGRKAVERPA